MLCGTFLMKSAEAGLCRQKSFVFHRAYQLLSDTMGTQSSSEWSSGLLLRMQSQGELEGRYHGQRCQ